MGAQRELFDGQPGFVNISGEDIRDSTICRRTGGLTMASRWGGGREEGRVRECGGPVFERERTVSSAEDSSCQLGEFSSAGDNGAIHALRESCVQYELRIGIRRMEQ